MNIQPLGDRVVVEPRKNEGGKLKSGLYLPETASKERPEQGTVVAVGPGKMTDAGKRLPMNVKKGDVVLFSTYREPVKFDDREYFVLSEDDIQGIIGK
jgi:chaperonin GroES